MCPILDPQDDVAMSHTIYPIPFPLSTLFNWPSMVAPFSNQCNPLHKKKKVLPFETSFNTCRRQSGYAYVYEDAGFTSSGFVA